VSPALHSDRMERRPLVDGGGQMERLCELHTAGVSIWLDTLARHLVASGEFGSLIDDACVTGATSNPTTFAAAIRRRPATRAGQTRITSTTNSTRSSPKTSPRRAQEGFTDPRAQTAAL
jgi:transaldolase